MLKLSKMVNFRTTPERYEQLKALALELPGERTIAALINHGLALAQEQLAGRIVAADRPAIATSRISKAKPPRPATIVGKTAAGPAKRKTARSSGKTR